MSASTFPTGIPAVFLDTPWWQSPRQVGDVEAETIWDARVAMRDTLFYEGPG
jgi:hypothetical protein